MKTIFEFIIHKTLFKNPFIIYNFLRFSPILIIVFLYSQIRIQYKYEYIVSIFLLIISIFIIGLITKNKIYIYDKFNYIKYCNSSSTTFLMYNQFEQKQFFKTIKNQIIEKDLKYERGKKSSFFDKINTRTFRESIVSELDFERFKNEIKSNDKSIWISNIFSYEKAYQSAVSIIIEKFKQYNCKTNKLTILKINNILINNINLYSTGVELDIKKLKIDMDNEFSSIKIDKQPIKTLDTNKRKVIDLISPFFPFDNNNEKTTNLINSEIYKLKKEDLIFYSGSYADAGRLLMLLSQKGILNDTDLKTIYIHGILCFNSSNLNKKYRYSDKDMLKSHKYSFLKKDKPTTSKDNNITTCLKAINQLYS